MISNDLYNITSAVDQEIRKISWVLSDKKPLQCFFWSVQKHNCSNYLLGVSSTKRKKCPRERWFDTFWVPTYFNMKKSRFVILREDPNMMQYFME